MSAFPGGTTVRRTISLQYNPDSLSRSSQIQGVGGEGGGERAQPFRLKGAALEALINPTTTELPNIDVDARGDTLEILRPEAPLVFFVWGKTHIVPVRVTDFLATETVFVPTLNSNDAKVGLVLRVLRRPQLSRSRRHVVRLLGAYARCAGRTNRR